MSSKWGLRSSARECASAESVTLTRLNSAPAALMLATRQLASRRAWKPLTPWGRRMSPALAPANSHRLSAETTGPVLVLDCLGAAAPEPRLDSTRCSNVRALKDEA